MTGSRKDDLARAHRLEATLPALLLTEGEELPCEAVNVSRTGLLLTGRATWPEEEELTLVLASTSGDLHVPVRVRVVRRREDPEGDGVQLAAEFIGDDPVQQNGIELLLSRLIEGHARSLEIPEVPAGAPPHEARKRLEQVPVAQRISLAQRGQLREREILLHDQNPQVLESLARNPGLLPEEARHLAASPHLLPSTLALLASDRRWTVDDELKILLISHANVPPVVADRLIRMTQPSSLRRALQKSSLSTAARTAILRRLTRPS